MWWNRDGEAWAPSLGLRTRACGGGACLPRLWPGGGVLFPFCIRTSRSWASPGPLVCVCRPRQGGRDRSLVASSQGLCISILFVKSRIHFAVLVVIPGLNLITCSTCLPAGAGLCLWALSPLHQGSTGKLLTFASICLLFKCVAPYLRMALSSCAR